MESYIFLRPGDATAEVDEAARRMRARHGSDEAAGFVKHLYVTRADQTVVFLTGPDVPLAAELRSRRGWMEPARLTGDEPSPLP
jgi:hypothetical protein